MDSSLILGIATVLATFLGPILAVQAQKFVEARHSIRNQKMSVFTTLMATRGSRLSPRHVEALNMIDMSFNGGSQRRTKTETEVLEAWRDYLDHLSRAASEINVDRWSERQNDLLISLLSAMAADLKLRYDRVLLRNGAYLPQAYTDTEREQEIARKLVIKVLSGEQELSMAVKSFPMDEAMVASQLKLQAGLTDLVNGQRPVKVAVCSNDPTSVENRPNGD